MYFLALTRWPEELTRACENDILNSIDSTRSAFGVTCSPFPAVNHSEQVGLKGEHDEGSRESRGFYEQRKIC